MNDTPSSSDNPSGKKPRKTLTQKPGGKSSGNNRGKSTGKSSGKNFKGKGRFGRPDSGDGGNRGGRSDRRRQSGEGRKGRGNAPHGNSRKKTEDTSKIPGFAARKAALFMLDAVLGRGEALDHSENAACRDLKKPEDRALAVAIVQDVLRYKVGLDEMMDRKMREPLPEDAKARTVLNMILVQILRMDTPPHAVIATCLPLLQGGARRLAHGVLSAILKTEPQLPAAQIPKSAANRWKEIWGEDMVAAANAYYAEPPQLDIILKNQGDVEKYGEALSGQSVLPGHIRVARGQRVEDLPGFHDGDWWVQDVAASMPVRLLGEGNGRKILDLCAAPGGKTMQLAANGWQVTALDNVPKRLERLQENLERTGLSAKVICADILEWQPEEHYDAVLLDAPCSATGIYRRHPDVLWRIDQNAIVDRAILQGQLLAQAAKWVKPGGALVYAVCSLEKVEGAGNITQFCADHREFTVAEDDMSKCLSDFPANMHHMAGAGYAILPSLKEGALPMDGFFCTKLNRK